MKTDDMINELYTAGTYDEIFFQVYSEGRKIGLDHKHMRTVFLNLLKEYKIRYDSSAEKVKGENDG